ncbi:conserved unknown protein [Ectocarpus siliculosus]|uniref:Aminodeoxychorismate lyase n=1 Tax=Ectocarpus siliculosus TaxID=2880 RepID=D8LGW0_ECTSI|nr:conserved unknown protein [Ectocarpus siliculosus]|eukprot:CBN75813.1 conserved unknown protein [Ectocarpus siliculosus]
MSAAGALCCFVASAFLQGQSFEFPARDLDSIGLSASEWVRGFKRSRFRNCISIVSPAEADHNRGGTELEMSSTTATSVWATCGEPEVRRCPAGGPLSSPQEFLLANPPGPYTCLRTVDHRSVAMLPFHLDRLWQSSQATGFGPAARAQGRQSLEQETVETIARVTESFREENAGGGCPECMTTVLYTHRRRLGKEDAGEGLSDDDQPGGTTAFTGTRTSKRPRKGAARPTKDREICIMAHAWPLPTPPVDGRPAGVKVLIAGSGRSLPKAKHSSWLRDRKRLEELKAQTGAQEVVLSEIGFSPEGTTRRLLLEGLTSNFFVVEEDGAVSTAPSGVLLGGMRQLLISVCDKEGIEVRFDAPDISRAGRWREAFLTGKRGGYDRGPRVRA